MNLQVDWATVRALHADNDSTRRANLLQDCVELSLKAAERCLRRAKAAETDAERVRYLRLAQDVMAGRVQK